MFAFISEFLFLIVGVVFIIISCVYNDSKSFYPSSVTLLVSVAALGMYYQADVLTLIEQYGTFKAIVTLTSIYILMGLITSLVYWMFYIIQVKERLAIALSEKIPGVIASIFKRYNYSKDWIDYVTALAKLSVVEDHLSWIFCDNNRDLKIYNTYLSIKYLDDDDVCNPELRYSEIDLINKKLRSILPPKFSDCHPFIVGAGLSWPITLFWMLLSKIIKNGLKTILNLFEGTFNMVSARLFGKI